jgi:hypothetical protein
METQAQIAARDLAGAIREFGRENHDPAGWEEVAATWEDIGARLCLEGDYDVLVARRLRAVASLLQREAASWERAEVEAKLRELLAEIRCSIG